jgi:hypothetical protein
MSEERDEPVELADLLLNLSQKFDIDISGFDVEEEEEEETEEVEEE